MLRLLLWRAGLVLEVLILVRGFASKMVTKFPYFYAYIFCVFGVSFGLYVLYMVSPRSYVYWYWPTQFLTLVAGCGVVLDIVQHGFGFYPGAERVARLACVAIFCATFFYVISKAAMQAGLTPPALTIDLERNLRVIQAVLVATVLSIVFYYRIRLGRNVAGLIVGFGTYVGASLMILAVRAYLGHRFDAPWPILQSSAYLFALMVWTIALWSYSPQAVPSDRTRMDGDYEALAGVTREILSSLRSYFRRTARS